MSFLCLDIGGTNTLFGIGNGDDFKKVKQLKTKEFLNDIQGTVRSVMKEAGFSEVDQVVVAAAGPVDREKGIFYPPNIDREYVNIREPLEEFAEMQIVNDCAAAAVGEYRYGESADSLLYVTMSSGIGAAYVDNGELVEGWNGNFGEIGHMRIGDEMECGCGGKGHWEAYCSGNNLPQMAEQLYGLEVDNAKEVFELEGEKAEKVIEEFNYRNKVGIANLINIYNPEKIVFGGAVALNHFDIIQESVEQGMNQHIVNEVPEMTLCGLGKIAVLHGLKARAHES